MKELSMYGMLRTHPQWWVRIRGLYWLKYGCCPCCNSSPPLPDCPICTGSRDYGHKLSGYHRNIWRNAWESRCRTW